MAANSSERGFLLPASSPDPLADAALDTFLHDLFVGLTGMDANAVRPRWQPEPPNEPDLPDDWLAFGVMDLDADEFATMLHQASDDGSDQMQRHETVEVRISTYGTNAMKNLMRLRDGILVEQNRDTLTAAGFGFLSSSGITPFPSLVKERWLHRYDMTWRARRQVRREYPILTLLSAELILQSQAQLNRHVIETNIEIGPLEDTAP